MQVSPENHKANVRSFLCCCTRSQFSWLICSHCPFLIILISSPLLLSPFHHTASDKHKAASGLWPNKEAMHNSHERYVERDDHVYGKLLFSVTQMDICSRLGGGRVSVRSLKATQSCFEQRIHRADFLSASLVLGFLLLFAAASVAAGRR